MFCQKIISLFLTKESAIFLGDELVTPIYTVPARPDDPVYGCVDDEDCFLGPGEEEGDSQYGRPGEGGDISLYTLNDPRLIRFDVFANFSTYAPNLIFTSTTFPF